MEPTFRVQVYRAWLGGGPSDPETYWVGRDEAVQLLDDVLVFERRQMSLWPVHRITVTKFDETGERELVSEFVDELEERQL